MLQPLCRRAFGMALFIVMAHTACTQTLAHRPAADAQESSADSPAGRWLAVRPSPGGIGSWWDFRPDHTLTMYIGAAATAHVTHTADILHVPSGKPDGSTIALDYKITGNILNLKRPGDPDTLFTRDGPVPKPSDPLLGRWRPNPPSIYSDNPQLAERQKAMTKGVYVFNADNTQIVRIPFTARTGTWDAAEHTLKIEGDTRTFTFARTAEGLTIGQQPPDTQKTADYIRDPLFPQ